MDGPALARRLLGAGGGPRGALLGLDVSRRVVGVAVSDAGWFAARPGGEIRRGEVGAAKTRSALQRLVQRHRAVGVVVGWPVDSLGREGGQCQHVRAFVEAMAPALGVPVGLWTEHATTKLARQRLDEFERAGSRAARARVSEDDVAACLMLEDFMEHCAGPLVDSAGRPGLPPRVPNL